MSRARVHEVSSPISLFPFIGILLCTMGALLVILVAVSRNARATAQRDVQTQSRIADPSADDELHKKLDEVKTYVGNLNSVRGQAERRIRDQQTRLSNVEDHIRRLQEKMRSLQAAASELHGLEEEHYDDRQQAEREVARLHQLIDDSQKTVASLRDANAKDSHSYAVVPYEGPNGTYRRPIYIECVKNELVLQPEGVRLAVDDLRPPIGPGNPLASVLRAGREHIVRLNPQAGKSRDTEPYPLLLVRPDGLAVFDRARQAIEAGDFELGFELVESDWKLKYPEPDPQLAATEQEALDLARARQQVLAAAAPRAYRNASVSAGGEFEFEDEGGGGSGASGSGRGGPGAEPGRGGPRAYIVRSNRYGGGAESGGEGSGNDAGEGKAPSDGNSSPLAGSDSVASDSHGGTSDRGDSNHARASQSGSAGGDGDAGGNGGASGGDGGDTPSVANASAGAGGAVGTSGAGGGAPGGGAPGSGPPGGNPPDKNLVPDGYQTAQDVSVTASTSAPPGSETRSEKERMNAMRARGKDWALPQKPARAIAVRRTIHVAVRGDQLVVLPDSAPATAAAPGKLIPMHGDTVESLGEFVKQVREHVDGWGIAGNGLYWRPVIALSVGPDGDRRAADLARLLKNSGLEIRNDETAKNLPQGAAHETR